MTLRSCLLTAAALALCVGACNQRDQLAPWDSLTNNCAEIPDGFLGTEYGPWTVQPRGGIAPYTWAARNLPPGLMIDPDTGAISGVPTEEGTWNVTIIVTDATGFTVEVGCGNMEIRPRFFDCEANAFPIAVQGQQNYSHTFMVNGGVPPFRWEITGDLPADLVLNTDGSVTGAVTADPGTYPVTVTVEDSDNPSTRASCDLDVEVRPGLGVDPNPLEDLNIYPDNCVPVNSGIDLDQLLADGVIVGGDGSPLRCEFTAIPDNPQIGNLGNGNLPNGISVNERCLAEGTVPQADPIGAYVWIVTVVQDTTGQRAYVPYCAKQQQLHPNAYAIDAASGGADVTFVPGYTPISGSSISFGDNTPDPIVTVEKPCPENFCFFSYYFSYNVFNPAEGPINAGPTAKLPNGGFTHGLQVNYNSVPESLQNRFWVANVRWDYCLYGTNAPDANTADAEFEATCGNKMLAQQNGDDSNLEFGLIVRPPDP